MIYYNSPFAIKYLYSPTTIYHHIKPYFKINCTFSILLLLPYNNSVKIINWILIIFLTIKTNIITHSLSLFELSKIQFIILSVNYIILINQLIAHKNIYHKHIKYLRLLFPYSLKISLCHFNKAKVILKYSYLSFKLPSYITKLIFIYTISNNILQTLYLCTKFESTLEIIIYKLNNIKEKFEIIYKDYVMNMFLGYLFLQELASCLISTSFGLQIKNINSFNKNKHNLSIILTKYFYVFLSYQNNYSLVLWNRNILYKNYGCFKIFH
uniref:Uncharacterized protein n=1 Tax=Laurenciella marilzae TaxID=1413812 RepID=A0A1Z1M1K7_9FLOR|nr:hypothetical protein [Laurenciella marilzae]ARW59780.1 hypothetical protein [Laurenciella marilzae]